jgi:hypothetical protein
MCAAMRLHVYLDTSVLSAYYDERVPSRRLQTEEFWRRRDEFLLSTSSVAEAELIQTPDQQLREMLLALLRDVTVFAVTGDMRDLAQRYVDAGAFGPAMVNDAVHVAAAVLSRQDILLSWNFRHLVNRRRRQEINTVNVLAGLQTIEIMAPPEL